ncbi:unnamed protein product [Caenorhabditis auriculariae]|uniref:Uncharacterized protein n=1 Tax=Caenorhabditis auriculariae TaxID=2777116 RepID=A0A8S1H9I5_9PELO|nr:unnamed protein product [Caenorhabditis auriculariae]
MGGKGIGVRGCASRAHVMVIQCHPPRRPPRLELIPSFSLFLETLKSPLTVAICLLSLRQTIVTCSVDSRERKNRPTDGLASVCLSPPPIIIDSRTFVCVPVIRPCQVITNQTLHQSVRSSGVNEQVGGSREASRIVKRAPTAISLSLCLSIRRKEVVDVVGVGGGTVKIDFSVGLWVETHRTAQKSTHFERRLLFLIIRSDARRLQPGQAPNWIPHDAKPKPAAIHSLSSSVSIQFYLFSPSLSSLPEAGIDRVVLLQGGVHTLGAAAAAAAAAAEAHQTHIHKH